MCEDGPCLSAIGETGINISEKRAHNQAPVESLKSLIKHSFEDNVFNPQDLPQACFKE